ncbi:cytochrome P450 [Streptomyces tendae]|uniref:cytochrome P450 n=1 Tax=Streptomyces tendae TaxID=1932 RepID=UPI0033EBBC98
MTETEPVTFPQDRSCPYQSPTGYEPLRATRPLTRVTLYDGRPVWMVTGHALARQLLADPRLSSDSTHPAFPATTEGMAAMRNFRVALMGVDDPEHHAQRRMLAPSFTLRRTTELRPGIQRIVDGLLDAMTEKGQPAELVSAFALPVASMVICELLGVPPEDRNFFEVQSQRLLLSSDVADVRDAQSKLAAYFAELVDRKQKQSEPGDGVLDELVQQQLREGVLDRQGVIEFATVLLIAGHESTANMISLGVYTLLQHPERLAELRADPGLFPAAVDELLRLLSVVDVLGRRATEDIEVGGTTIRTDDGVLFSPSVINREEDLYPAPDTLDWHRSTRQHFAFGFGIHQCLAQNLARAELEIALHTLFDRLPGLRLASPPEEIPFRPGYAIQGMLELPVTW